jgi:hypothetical protein
MTRITVARSDGIIRLTFGRERPTHSDASANRSSAGATNRRHGVPPATDARTSRFVNRTA